MWPNPLETAKSTMKPTSGFERRTPRLFIWLDNHGLHESKIIADMKAKLGTCDGIFVLSISMYVPRLSHSKYLLDQSQQ